MSLTDALSFSVGLDTTEVERGLKGVEVQARKTGAVVGDAFQAPAVQARKYGAIAESITDGEKRLAAQIIGQKAALSARASALGLNVSEMQAMIKSTQATQVSTVAVTDATAKATSATLALKSGARGLAQQLPDVFSQLASGTPILSIFAQQGLQVAQTTQGLGSAMMAAAPLIAATVIAAEALGIAYIVTKNATLDADEATGRYNQRLEESRGRLARMAESADVATKALERIRGEVSQTNDRLAELTGVSQFEVDLKNSAKEIKDGFGPAIQLARGRVEEYKLQLESLQRQQRSSGSAELTREIATVGTELERERQTLRKLTEERQSAIDTAEMVAFGEQALEEAAEAETKAKEAQTEAARRHREELELAQRIDRDQRDAIMSNVSANRELSAMNRELAVGTGDLAEKEFALIQQMEARIAVLDELVARGVDEVEAAAAAVAIEAETQAQIQQLREDSLKHSRAILVKRAADAKAQADKEIAEQRRIQQVVAQSASSLMGSFAAFAGTIAQEQAGNSREAAEKAYRAQRAAAIGGALLDAAAASVRAFQDYPFPASLVVSAAAGVAALANVAALVSQPIPSFNDTPGVIQAGQGGLVARFAPEDYIIAAKDPADILGAMQEYMSAGVLSIPTFNDTPRPTKGPAPPPRRESERTSGSVVVVQSNPYKHFDRFWRDYSRANARVSQSIRSASPRGQTGF